MSQDPEDEDGQLHTLGLLERLRSETNLVRGAYDGLYGRVDKLLRELENPNLHDIANMSFRVELWDQSRTPYPLGCRRCRICFRGTCGLR